MTAVAGGRRTRPRPFAWQPLEAFRVNRSEAARVLGVSVRTIHRWRHQGLTVDAADELALLVLDVHPALIWPDEWPDESGDNEADDLAPQITLV